MRIAIIGAGNVATVLARSFTLSGQIITSVSASTISSAKALAVETGSTAVEINNIPVSDLIFIAVNDDAIEGVVNEISSSTSALVVHVAGSKPLQILQKFKRAGVFYPLVSLTGKMIAFPAGAPVLVEARSGDDAETLTHLAQTIGALAERATSEDRFVLHLSAVFANNFSNYLLHCAYDLLEKHNLNFSLLLPLIKQTFEKISATDPIEHQTGPAARNDLKLMKKHLEYLKNDNSKERIYNSISEEIIKLKHEQK